MHAKQTRTILIADDHPIVATALAASLRDSYKVVGVVTKLERLEVEVARLVPDVLLLDLTFGTQSSLPVLDRIRASHVAVRVVVLTIHCERVLADAALKAGALAFVVKEGAPSELLRAIDAVLAGRRYVTPLVNMRRNTGADSAEVPGRIQLSELERKLLAQLFTSNQRDAAKTLRLSVKGIEYHLTKLRRRLGVSTTAELLRWVEKYLRM